MRSYLSRGFTLIELLVVISIIGMLSSVVLASVQSARDRGRVAAGLTFERHVKGALGDKIIAEYDFNNPDTSSGSNCIFPVAWAGTGLNLRTVGTGPCTPSVVTSPAGTGKSLEWDFTGSVTPVTNPVTVPSFTDFAIGFWFRAEKISPQEDRYIYFGAYNPDDTDIIIDGSILFQPDIGIEFFAGEDPTGASVYWGIEDNLVYDGKWHYILFNLGSIPSVFLDGKKLITNSTTQNYSAIKKSMYLEFNNGINSSDKVVFIDNLIIYGDALDI